MRTLGRMLVALPLVAALVGVAAPAAVAKPVRSFTFTAEAGAHPVNGRSGQWTPPDAEIDVHEFERVIKMHAETHNGWDWIRVEFRGRDGAALRRGVYRTDAKARPDGPRMLVISNGLGCIDDYGRFTITRIRRDSSGQLSALDARFEHHCGSATAPALRGEIRYRA